MLMISANPIIKPITVDDPHAWTTLPNWSARSSIVIELAKSVNPSASSPLSFPRFSAASVATALTLTKSKMNEAAKPPIGRLM
jgi:hypothetical protein